MIGLETCLPKVYGSESPANGVLSKVTKHWRGPLTEPLA